MATNALTKKQAELRSNHVSNVKYLINLNLDRISKQYKGKTKISFQFIKSGIEELIVDFITDTVHCLKLNGTDTADYRKDEFWLYINSHNLFEGDIIIFPSKIKHATNSNITKNTRISISGDITIMLKDSSGHEKLMPHFNNWQPF